MSTKKFKGEEVHPRPEKIPLDNSSFVSILGSNEEIGGWTDNLPPKAREGEMGRTVLAFSQVMEAERERFRGFGRALSKEDQEAFDRLFDRAKILTSAGVYMSNPWPMDTILLSILLEQGKMIEEILGLLKEKKG